MLAKPDITLVDLTQPRDLFLSKDEEQRAARFHFAHDKERWSRAHSALRSILGAALQKHPLDFSFLIGPHGKPSLAGLSLHFNLSHAGTWALVATCIESPVGVDIERIRHDVEIADLLKRIGEDPPPGTTEEHFQLWARREARTKAAGASLMDPPDPAIRVTDLTAPSGYVAAVATYIVAPFQTFCGTNEV